MNTINCSKGHPNPIGGNFCIICGERLSQSSYHSPTQAITLNTGTKLRDRYIILKQIGHGGFGKTYLVQDTGRFQEKLLLKEFIPPQSDPYALQKSTELFQREAVTLYQLQHPQIPRFYEIFQDASRLFLVEDFIEGHTYQELLNERLQQGRNYFNENEIKELFQKILPVLSYLHKSGIVHRDISPDNIILNPKNNLPYLIDLGAVKQIAFNVTNTYQNPLNPGTTIGKVGYAPDEQMRLGIVAPYSDLYALGVTAIVLLTGKQPHELLDQYTMEWTWQKYIKISPLLTQILTRMLAARPERRFQAADEILALLNPGLTHRDQHNFQPNNDPHQLFVNNSGQGNIFDDSVPVPPEIKGWNWGAFLLGFLWSLGNRVWIGLLCFIPYIGFIMAIMLGIKGNEWAWKSRRWDSIEQFKKSQRSWTVAGLIVGGIFFIIGFLAAIADL